ncbi:hypothetical protein SAMN05216358_4208 [Rhizobium sp. AN5]|uniref:hypothetical protein n=1 Tax=Rhizobium sp. AN5 TaxID=1855304 RepID=UPI000BD7440C|nr:hypothetical protein [Rhizobium sp. AN5]SOC94008.1 hypothetical protein SAMN05216358_4208 [Rhizobium sp. AN5]
MRERKAILALRRQFLEAWIEEAIRLLDELDGECDLEDNGDMEPSVPSTPRLIMGRVQDDLEFDTSDFEPHGDEGDYSAGRLAGGCGL